MAFQTVNPATGEPGESYDEHDADEIAWRLAKAEETFHDWRETSFDQRSELLARVADLLDERQDELAELMVTEMGKPIAGARSEVEKCAWVCRHYAEHAEGYLERDLIDTDAETSYVRFDPLGPLFAIMPWNFPLWQVFRAAAPSIMAGNTVLLKHAANVPGCALAIEDLFASADAPNGLFQTLMIQSRDAGEVIADERIRAVTLTGSVGAGRAVAEQAGANLKKTVLELGGSDAFIVLEDADLDHTVPLAVQSRLINNGESCIAAKRFIVVEDILDDFLDRFVEEMASVTVGDPMDPDTDVGPLAREDLRDDLHDQVQRTVDAAGAKLVLGGQPIDGPGFFYEPTVIAGVEAEMAGAQEETFGPAAVVMSAEHEEAAIALANASDFGLGASVWTSDLKRGQRVAGRVDAGCLFVNQLVKSDPRVPFGGVKDSGYGRELGAYGIKEFVNAKTVWVEKAS
ncbi:MAG: NAD-dependent succinate-semialdehyde dehydrogenase [Nitriliruptorales bacterium]|nr:NAD-dependent succinate-semialdehyde dehydrogenase [Nitriliruptorales bacterium]